MKARQEPLTQRALVYRLRALIDEEQRQPSLQRRRLIAEIVETHPIGIHSTHVQHNLGIWRLEWLGREIDVGEEADQAVLDPQDQNQRGAGQDH